MRKNCQFPHTFIKANEFLPPLPLDDYDGTGWPEVAQYLVKDEGRPGDNNSLKIVFHVSSSRCGGPPADVPVLDEIFVGNNGNFRFRDPEGQKVAKESGGVDLTLIVTRNGMRASAPSIPARVGLSPRAS